MAVLTPLSLDAAQRIGRSFGLAVRGVRGLAAGSVNSNFEIELEGSRRVFLRVYEEQTHSTASGEAALLAHLAARGVPTPRPLEREGGGFIDEHDGKPVALFPWSPGESRCQKAVDARAAFEVGAALARVHEAGASFSSPPPSRFGPRDLARRLEGLRARELPLEITELLPALERRLAPHLEHALEEDGLIHGDLFRDNVLWEGDRISALLDFESASIGSHAFDLMVTALAWCMDDHLEPALVRSVGEGYASTRALPDAGSLFDAASLAALRFTITRITDYELRPRGKGVYKDFRRFLARLETVEALGSKGLAELVGGASA